MFQWPAKAGWGFRGGCSPLRSPAEFGVSMASKGRMGIQDPAAGGTGGVGGEFQWPAKAGWGFRPFRLWS